MADTQAMSSLVKALNGVLPDSAVRALMQALGNCTQPTSNRAPADFQPNYNINNNNGVYRGGSWNPSQYPGLLPSAGSGGFVERPMDGGSYNNVNSSQTTNNYGGNAFFFPTNQAFNLSNFYGGPSFTVGGNSNFNNIVTNNITTQQITVTGGGGGGVSFQMPQQPAAQPGDGGFSGVVGGGGGAGGGVPGNGGGIFLLPPIGIPGGNPFFQQTRNVALTARGSVDIPSSGELADDCSIKLTNPKPTRLNITVSPDFLKVFA